MSERERVIIESSELILEKVRHGEKCFLIFEIENVEIRVY